MSLQLSNSRCRGPRFLVELWYIPVGVWTLYLLKLGVWSSLDLSYVKWLELWILKPHCLNASSQPLESVLSQPRGLHILPRDMYLRSYFCPHNYCKARVRYSSGPKPPVHISPVHRWTGDDWKYKIQFKSFPSSQKSLIFVKGATAL